MKLTQLSQHPKAIWYLIGIGFLESCLLPFPVLALLVPMVWSKPEKFLNYIGVTTLASVLGGVAGYLLGRWAFVLIEPLIFFRSNAAHYHTIINQLQEWYFWSIVVSGFSPLPYKLVSIASGALQVPLGSFVTASLLGRFAKFAFSALMSAKLSKYLALHKKIKSSCGPDKTPR